MIKRIPIAGITLVVCVAGATATCALIALAAWSAPADSYPANRVAGWGWLWEVWPYAALASVAFVYRHRRITSVVVMCVILLATLIALVATYEDLRSTPANLEFVGGLGINPTPLALWLVAFVLAIAIEAFEIVRRTMNSSSREL